MEHTLRRSAAIRDGLGVGIAVGLSGLAFGAAAITAGLSVAQACVLSLLAFTGASQFALVGGGGDLTAAVGALLLGTRNTLYGLRLADILQVRGARRLLAAQGVIDESTAVSLAQPDTRSARAGFVATFAAVYVMWNLTTLLGALGTSKLGDPAMLGLDAVGPATFLAILWPRLRENPELRWLAVGGAAIALLATPVLPPGVPVLLASVAVLVMMVRSR